MRLLRSSGCLYAVDLSTRDLEPWLGRVPTLWRENRLDRDGDRYHITVIHDFSESFEPRTVDEESLIVLGLAVTDQLAYLVVYSEEFNRARRHFGLPPLDAFHITLGFRRTDLHTVSKGYETIRFKNPTPNLSTLHTVTSRKLLEHVATEYDHLDDQLLLRRVAENHAPIEAAEELIKRGNYLGWVLLHRLTSDSGSREPKALDQAVEFYRPEIQQRYDRRRKITDYLISELNSREMLVSTERRKIFYLLDSDGALITHEMPRNFSWVRSGVIGGISAIRTSRDFEGVLTLGIRKIFYFLEKAYFEGIDNPGVEIEYIACENGYPPAIEDVDRVLEQLQTIDQPVLFGCLGGFGRTGTALACYLAATESLSSNEAVKKLRAVRPKSIENRRQLDFVREYSNHLFAGARSKTPDYRLIMLVGLPGSGKSTFTELLGSADLELQQINQDLLKTRTKCEKLLVETLKTSATVVLDRTNLSVDDRAKWLTLAKLPAKKVLCVEFTTPESVCQERIAARKNHPTIKGDGKRLLAILRRRYESPTVSEGFDRVVRLESSEDVRNYLKTWGCRRIELEMSEPEFRKFPRTRHFINLGGASRDDLLVGQATRKKYFESEVLLTEKVDGAQLGFSIAPDYTIRAQNRSHYVNSAYHSQFKLLDKWIEEHRADLYAILEPGQILFGEWMYARHSLGYTKLPDYFLAFDLYDGSIDRFFNRRRLLEKLDGTSIRAVPEIARIRPSKVEQLTKHLNATSAYGPLQIEGVYLKIENDNYVVERSKIVRDDFIAGNDHWSKGVIERNTVLY